MPQRRERNRNWPKEFANASSIVFKGNFLSPIAGCWQCQGPGPNRIPTMCTQKFRLHAKIVASILSSATVKKCYMLLDGTGKKISNEIIIVYSNDLSIWRKR